MRTIKETRKEIEKRFGKKATLKEVEAELEKYVKEKKLNKKRIKGVTYYYEDNDEAMAALVLATMRRKEIVQ